MRKNEDKEQFTVLLDNSSRPTLAKGHKEKPKRIVQQGAWFYLGFIGEVGYTIALPIAGGALLGEYIDRHWSTYPKATLSLLFVGIVVSMVGLVRTVYEVIHKKN